MGPRRDLACQHTEFWNFGAMATKDWHYSEKNGEKNWISRLLPGYCMPQVSGKIAFVRLILGTWLEVKGLALPDFMIEIEFEAYKSR